MFIGLLGRFAKRIFNFWWGCIIRCLRRIPLLGRCFRDSAQLEEEKANYLKELAEQGIESFSEDILADLKVGPLQDYYKKAYKEW